MRDIFKVLALFVFAFSVRVAFVGQANFGADEKRYFSKLVEMKEKGVIPVYGPDLVIGKSRLPSGFFFYILYPPVALGGGVKSVEVWVGFLNSLGVFFIFYAVRKIDRKTALWSSVLYSLSPWAVLGGLSIWNPSLLPILGSVAFFLIMKAKDSPHIWAFLVVLGAVFLSIHLAAFGGFLIGTVILLWKDKNRKELVKWMLIGGAVSVLILIPTAVKEISSNLKNVRGIFSGGSGVRVECLKSLFWVWILDSSFAFEYLPKGELLKSLMLSLKGIPFWISAVSIVGVVVGMVRLMKGRCEVSVSKDFLTGTLSVPIGTALFILLILKPAEPRYFYHTLPFGLTLLSVVLSDRWKWVLVLSDVAFLIGKIFV